MDDEERFHLIWQSMDPRQRQYFLRCLQGYIARLEKLDKKIFELYDRKGAIYLEAELNGMNKQALKDIVRARRNAEPLQPSEKLSLLGIEYGKLIFDMPRGGFLNAKDYA